MIKEISQRFITPLVDLFYPHLCAGCGNSILEDHHEICFRCLNNLSKTGYAPIADNPIEKKFWGRITLHAATAEFYFTKESPVQKMIYELKYKNNKAIGVYLGKIMGRSLLSANRFAKIDCIVPVPLHKRKERKRGYNQALLIARGVSNILKVPVLENNVITVKDTETQTKKHRRERWENVVDKFAVKNPGLLCGRQVLLIDDVLTTGATLDACATTILKIQDIKLSIAVLAVAND